jgi:hypothetical protein
MGGKIQLTDNLDDWRSEFLSRLQKSYLYFSLEQDCNVTDKEVIVLIENAVAFSITRTKAILRHMDEYTLHDDIHLFRVLYLMERLLTKDVIDKLSVPERMLLILSAFFHDIGMSPDEKEIITWKKVWDASPEIKSEEEQKLFDRFKRYYDARPDQQEIIDKLITDGNHSKASLIKSYLLTDFIRQTHAERARAIIGKYWNGQIKYRDTDLTVELANICHSHNEDALKLLDLDKYCPCGNGMYACLPLIGVILRLADILDFDAKRTPRVLYSHLYVRNPVSIMEWEKHRAIENWEINPNIIQFSAKCTHPAIQASIHEFCDLIDHELSICNNIISTLNEFNQGKSRPIQVKIPFQVTRDKIETKKDIFDDPYFTYKDTKFTLSKGQVIDLLMGTKLYGNPEIALRELLQNSIDACLLRKAQELKWGYTKYEAEITVKYYSENGEDILKVTDNGTGMDQYIIDNYYSKVGSSFYKSADFHNLKAESNADFIPTSRFGIGILSCFMVSDTLIVDTKRILGPHKSTEPLNITVEGQESIFWIKSGEREVPGTTTKLILRKTKNPWNKMKEEEFIKSVERVIPNPPFKINIETDKTKTTRDEHSFREFTADSLKDYSWNKNHYIRTFDISLNNKELGIVGSAIVAILEKRGKPVESIEINSREVVIEGCGYTLERSLNISENSIEEDSKSITIDDDGDINEDNSFHKLNHSISRISLHGIEIPSTLFPNSWEMKPNQVKITWPFPLVLVIDICGTRDLDLNSSRTEIIKSEKWIDFEEELAFQICNEVFNKVTSGYWENWKEILIKNTKCEEFLRGLNRIK